MTGRYPHKVGLQHKTISATQPNYVPLQFDLLPKKLKEQNYTTHMIGKWHLGFCNTSLTPTERGFDSFFGFYNGGEDYYNQEIGLYRDFRWDLNRYDLEASSYNSYSTNGGQPNKGGNNYPLRGTKGTYWEGGTRVPGFIYSKTELSQTGYTSDKPHADRTQQKFCLHQNGFVLYTCSKTNTEAVRNTYCLRTDRIRITNFSLPTFLHVDSTYLLTSRVMTTALATLPVSSENIAFSAQLKKGVLTDMKAGQTIKFDDVITNEGNGYSKESGIFTAPLGGMYTLSWSFLTYNKGHAHLFLYRNGNEVFRTYSGDQSNRHETGGATINLRLNTGDKVELRSGTNGGNLHHLYSVFSGIRVFG
ncbi:hypothetical protein FSP39_015341 [Pinctada imbricata]|uniref:C1q domain-containing protein n=1 Tax=Pinctada imbricata TaxID=66713 RepID=A0AA88YNA5_PINIB|nr:hypothetical protein FSP39_015341 [Pinctada imbricata]